MLGRKEILALLPHGAAFLFLDAAEVDTDEVFGRYRITGEECFAGAHFPGRYVFPASIMSEALGQLGVVYLSHNMKSRGLRSDSIFFISSEDVSCRRQCRPGETLEMHLKLLRVREPLIVFSGSIHVDGDSVLKVSSLTLSFSTQA